MQDSNNKNLESDKEWPKDVFSRRQYAVFLSKLLVNKNKPFVLNINAVWGAGKTFFLNNWYKDVRKDHPVVMFNAWESDYADDPLLTFLSCIKQDLIPLIEKKEYGNSKFKNLLCHSGSFLKSVAPIVAKGVTAKLIGEGGIDELADIVSEDEKSISEFSGKATGEFLKLFKKSESSIESFKEELSEIINQTIRDSGLSSPLFIFIDELDRCRPTFAIEALESIKHLFDIDEVVFIIATDTEQLSHSVKAIYGEGFNGRVYLKRFFNQEYSLPEPNHVKFAEMLFQNFENKSKLFNYALNLSSRPIDSHIYETNSNEDTISCGDIANNELVAMFALFADFFDLDLRTQKQCFDKFDAITLAIPHNEELHYAYVFFLIMLESKYPDKFKQYFSTLTIQNRVKIFENLSESGLNVRSYSNLINAKEIIHLYSELSLESKEQLRDIFNSNSNRDELYNYIAVSIFNNYKNISNYKSKIELVGALS